MKHCLAAVSIALLCCTVSSHPIQLNDDLAAFSHDDAGDTTLVGVHYFGGWYECNGVPGCDDHYRGYSPLGKPTTDWRQYFPERIPTLGNSTVLEDTIVAEVREADRALDYFDVLWYDGGGGAGIAGCDNDDPNLAHCLDMGLAWMINSTRVWSGAKRLHFFITFSNDIDARKKAQFMGDDGLALWHSYIATWVNAMRHPRYLKINGRPVFKILIPDIFLNTQCGANATWATDLLQSLRDAAVAAGVGNPIIGGGWQNPSIPAHDKPSPLPHPDGFMRYQTTDIACPTCDLGAPTSVDRVQSCEALCNRTIGCAALTVTRQSSISDRDDDSNDSGSVTVVCQLKTVVGPGSGNSSLDTYVRVPGHVQYDFTGTYNAAPPVCPDQPNWECQRYVDSWFPNATATGAKIFPYEECAKYQGVARGNHTGDDVPYVASVIGGFDPRPWQEHSPSFTMPTRTEWTAAVAQAKAAVEDASSHFGFPDASMSNGIRPAFTIYAWNEYGEGGIVAPTRGDGTMKVDVIAEVFGRDL